MGTDAITMDFLPIVDMECDEYQSLTGQGLSSLHLTQTHPMSWSIGACTYRKVFAWNYSTTESNVNVTATTH